MTDYWFKMFTFIRKSIFLVTILLASFCLLIQLSTNTKSDSSITSCNVEEQSKTRAAQKFHISSMCNCSKRVPIGGDESSGFKWCSDESSIRGRHQKIITYTVFGDAQDDASVFRRYFSSIRNISQTASKMYPGWVMRIYHNIVESQSEAQKQLCKAFCRHPNIDLCSINRIADQIQPNSTTPIDPKLIRGLNPKMFRYLVMLDPNVDVFISRDIDSLIWHREVDAVKEWLSSNYTFHLMRDHTGQDAIISAGMFGIKVHQRRDLIEGLARALMVSGQNQDSVHDQASLDQIVWPTAKHDVMAHDSYHCENERLLQTTAIKVFPFPTQRKGNYYVGGVGHDLVPIGCPLACRPPEHPDWLQC